MKTLIYAITILLLIIIGFFLYQPFFEFSIAIVSLDNIELVSSSISSNFNSRLVFSAVIGFIPILYFVIQRATKINLWFDGAYVLIFIIFFGGLSSILRGVYISEELMSSSGVVLDDDIKPSFPIDSFNFEYYLLMGFILGALISFLLLCLKSKLQYKI